MTSFDIALIVLCLVGGGIIKGATGAGAPLFAVPVITAIVDLHFAIVVMLVTTIVTNFWQAWVYRKRIGDFPFLPRFLAATAVGSLIGTFMLASLPLALLTGILSVGLIAYILLRVLRPDWVLEMTLAARLAVPAGLLAGWLAGATGLSAPVSLPYLTSLRRSREAFVGSISAFFLICGLVQFPLLYGIGIIDWSGLATSSAALIPVFIGMVAGHRLGRLVPTQTFQNLLLVVLAGLAVKLAWDAVYSFNAI